MEDRTCNNNCKDVCGECQIMKNVKLYTEEQVKKAIELARVHKPNDFITWFSNHDDDIIDSLTPIELPSDEEIDKFAQIASSTRKEKTQGEWIAYKSVIAGAKWVIEQIKQQDNGQG